MTTPPGQHTVNPTHCTFRALWSKQMVSGTDFSLFNAIKVSCDKKTKISITKLCSALKGVVNSFNKI